MHIYPPFQGFSPELFRFLNRLKRNNEREWFQPRKEEYEALGREPMQCLVDELGRLCAKTCPGIIFNPKKAVFRIYRDTRFSNDKTPYKTHVAASFHLSKKSKDEETPGFYLHIEPNEIFMAAGLYMPSSRQLKNIRANIASDPAALKKILGSTKFKGKFKKLQGEQLKRKPKDYAADHPDIELLRYKQFYIHLGYTTAQAQKKDFAKKVAADFAAAMPFIRWVAEASA